MLLQFGAADWPADRTGRVRPANSGCPDQRPYVVGMALLDVPDGRTLEYVVTGAPAGMPLVLHHALACAALLAERCMGAALVGGVAPYGVAGLDWMAGMGKENVAEFGAALAGEAALTEFLRQAGAAVATIKAADLAAALGDLASDVDAAALTGIYADYLAESFRASVSAGIDGWRDDDLAFVHDWAVPLDTSVPVSIWQGDQDRMVPHTHGEWLAAHLPGARLHRRLGQGHLSLFTDELDAIVAGVVG